MRRLAAVLGWFAALTAAAVVLRTSATGELAAPPLESLGALTEWAEVRSPVAAALALVRLVAECTVWYLVAVSGLHLSITATGSRSWRRLAETVTPQMVRRILDTGFGVSLLTTMTLAPSAFTSPLAADGPVPAATPIVPDDGDRAGRSGTATMRPVEGPTPPSLDPSPAPRPVPERVAPATTVEVSPGDSFWTLAEEALASAWGRTPTDAEIDPFWRALIERNRHRLVDPADVDLLLPGQVLELPSVPAATG